MYQGWCWEDDDWHIDMTGLASQAVDEDGWSYAVDFGWLQLPPASGSGRYRKVTRPAALQDMQSCSLATFVCMFRLRLPPVEASGACM